MMRPTRKTEKTSKIDKKPAKSTLRESKSQEKVKKIPNYMRPTSRTRAKTPNKEGKKAKSNTNHPATAFKNRVLGHSSTQQNLPKKKTVIRNKSKLAQSMM